MGVCVAESCASGDGEVFDIYPKVCPKDCSDGGVHACALTCS